MLVGASGRAIPPYHEFGWWLLLIGAALLSVQSFGAEFAHGTGTLLLSQPAPLRRIWRVKLKVLAATVGALFAAFLGVGVLQQGWQNLPLAFGFGALVAVASVGGGLFFSLLTRQVGPALWLAILCPLGILPAGGLVAWAFNRTDCLPWVWGVLAAGYGVTTFFLARRRFLTFQDVAGQGTDVSLSLAFLRSRKRPSVKGGRQAALRALRRKEWRLQQLNFVAAGLLTLLTLSTVVAMRLIAFPAEYQVVWGTMVICWGLVPFLVGAVTVAEERRVGIHEWQKTLPMSQSQQWRIKVRTALGVSFLLGFLLPVILDAVCLHYGGFWDAGYLVQFLPARLGVWFVGTLVGLYASSLSRNLMQSLSVLAVLGVLVAVLVIGARLLWGELTPPPTRLGYIVVGMLLCGCLLWLGSRNFRDDVGGIRLAWLNGLALLTTLLLGIGLTALIYQRSWEVLASEDVGPALPAKAGVHPRLVTALGNGATVAALTPDGNVWAHYQGCFPPWRISAPRTYIWETRCLSATNGWRDVAACSEAVYAIRDDGSLWAWGYEWVWTTSLPKALKLDSYTWNAWGAAEIPAWQERSLAPPPAWYMKAMHRQPSDEGSGALPEAGGNEAAPSNDLPANPIPDDAVEYSGLIPVLPEEQPWRVGSATNWTSIAGGDHHVIGLKRDGTVWAWGYGIDGGACDPAMPASSEPVRWAPGTNWVTVADAMPGRCLALRADGEIRQMLNVEFAARSFRIETAPGSSFGTEAQILGGGFCTGLLAAGALWVSPKWYFDVGEEPSTVKLQPVGVGSEWRTAADALDSLWAVRSDGSLWVWWRGNPLFLADLGRPARRGRGPNWIGLARAMNSNATYGLTADGKVWVFSDKVYRGPWYDGQRLLLAPTRRPVLMTQFGGDGQGNPAEHAASP